MKKFNINKSFSTVLHGRIIPIGAFYGSDSYGTWYTTMTTGCYPCVTPRLAMNRCYNGKWYFLEWESSETVSMIKEICDRKNLWHNNVQYPIDRVAEAKKKLRALEREEKHFNEMKYLHSNSSIVRGFKGNAIKRGSSYYASIKEDASCMIKLDVAEHIIAHIPFTSRHTSYDENRV